MYFSSSQWLPSPQTLPAQRNIFAVGDIHGHYQALTALNAVIAMEIAAQPELEHTVIYLGDYIDRGPNSQKVLEILQAGPHQNVETIFLRGNHEQFLIDLLKFQPWVDDDYLECWHENGGDTTLRDLQISDYLHLRYTSAGLQTLSSKIAKALGPDLAQFLDKLQAIHRIGNYVFVHAGVDPQKPLAAQSEQEFLWIRTPFMQGGSDWQHDFTAVHGHSITIPSVYPHRISVDAGCYHTGMLCAVQIRGDKLRFIRVTQQPNYVWKHDFLGKDHWQWSEARPVVAVFA